MRVGVHTGTYHSDDVTGVVLLRYVLAFRDFELVRTFDLAVLSTCDLVFDIGCVYDHSRKRYDHHQRGFNETFSPAQTVKLCGCGLLFKHYGNEIVKNVLSTEFMITATDSEIESIKNNVYDTFLKAIDANDNGVDVSNGELLYRDTTTLTARIKRYNTIGKSFEDAVALAQPEFLAAVYDSYQIVHNKLPIVRTAFTHRFEINPSGNVIYITDERDFTDAIQMLENEERNAGNHVSLLYVIQKDSKRGEQWRATALPKQYSYIPQKCFPEAWRGLRDETLSSVSHIAGCVFCHASGFLACNKTFEGIIQMVQASLIN
ncbi:hypothetical protein EIN_129170 [Entamoeba invadens IP1]|uniref:Uncharacterized protein n=1 Tax=Entamoeba invadens IP1 TaxID=370355 RepID=L7FMJ5_ENTIV|nr:hypothetical protein EIN_129170 [Entamoeba invadens IP1]ELP91577.1 hypothetical protein EIN_129170 [Entamoeba invadens IP1]|eukprot:XP_004258348.1 hypothetical protein EIN_129170 [Entamoeba invadens IP1]